MVDRDSQISLFVPVSAASVPVDRRGPHELLPSHPRCRATSCPHRTGLLLPPPSPWRDLPGDPRVGLPHAAAGNEPAAVELPLQQTDACALSRDSPGAGGAIHWRAVDHLRARDDDVAAAPV